MKHKIKEKTRQELNNLSKEYRRHIREIGYEVEDIIKEQQGVNDREPWQLFDSGLYEAIEKIKELVREAHNLGFQYGAQFERIEQRN